MTARLLMIGLDGADSDLIDRWSTDGTLPNIGALRSRGTAHHLEAPHGVTDDALWANFQYAAGLGEHGRFHYYQRLGDGHMGMAFREEEGRERFWDSLSAAGQRIAIIDIPKCAAPRPINGIHLCDWLVHGHYFKAPRSYPESLAAEIVAKFGAKPQSWCDYHQSRAERRRREVLANLLRSAEMKEAAGVHYLKQEHWDLFAIGFKEAHCGGHHFWDLSDPNHPEYDAVEVEKLGTPLRTIFQRLDQAVGQLVEAAGPGARVVLFSTTKMEPNASIHHIEPRLERRLNRTFAEWPATQVLRRVLKRRPPIEIVPYNENGTAIRINRGGKGRERLVQQLEAIFDGLTDAETGAGITDTIYHPSADYPGSRASRLPDLLIRYRAGNLPTAINVPGLGRLEAPLPEYRTGNHACGPFVIGAGIDITKVAKLEDFGELARRG